ncbi:MAG: tRNA-dihydrouridine synthase family protein [Deltaproteobacteria bacterium]|nr:tRNA-dihydrouridine synthase family protein [Deltaproteobacteria bacterium]
MSKPYIIGDCILAPMAGITGYPFRKIALKYGASFCFTEMISAVGYINNDKSTLELAYSGSYSANTGIQIFGSDPYIMGLAAKKAIQSGFKTIDINFGCPAKKVIKTGAGSAVLKDLDKFKAIIAEVKNNIGNDNILTIKLRSGFDESSKNYLESCKIAENEGVDAIFFHPRTRSQMFSGKADHSLTALLKKSLSIPVYATGDILDVSSAKKIKENTAVDGIMFARGAIGKPWIFQDFIKYTDKKYKEQKSQYKYLDTDNQKTNDRYLDTVDQKSIDNKDNKYNKDSDSDLYLNLDKIAELFEEMAVFYGEKKGANLIKPHLYNFITGFENAKLYRLEVNNARSYNDIINIFKNINILNYT